MNWMKKEIENIKKLPHEISGKVAKLLQTIAELIKEPEFTRSNKTLAAFFKQGDHVRMVARGIAILFLCYILGVYGLQPRISSTVKADRDYLIQSSEQYTVAQGDIVDRNGELIRGGAEKGVRPAVEEGCNFPVLGYTMLSEETRQQEGQGLLQGVAPYLLYYPDADGKGATVVLTLDKSLQQDISALLETEPFNSSSEGSCIIIMDNATGEIIAYACRSSVYYDVDNPKTVRESGVSGAVYIRGAFEKDAPGSVFKMLTSLAMYRYANETGQNIYDFIHSDSEGLGDVQVTNYDGAEYEDMDITFGFVNSVNTYFAYGALTIGEERLTEMASAFKIGEDIEIPFFETIESNFHIESGNRQSLADAAYGQGETTVTPLNILLVCNAIANNGEMVQPHLVKEIYSQKKTLYEEETSVIAEPITEDEASFEKEIMAAAAEAYGLDTSYGPVYAKTGTAECEVDPETGELRRSHTYLAGCTDNFSFIISCNDGEHSSALYDTANQVIGRVNEYYQNNVEE